MWIRFVYFTAFLGCIFVPLLVAGSTSILSDPRVQIAIGLGITWALVESSLDSRQFARNPLDLIWVITAILGAMGAFTLVVFVYVHRPELTASSVWVPAAGFGLAAAGLAIRYLAIRTLGEFFSHELKIADGHRIVETGLYRRVRHPSYLGFAMICFGVPLLFGSVSIFLFILFPILAAVTVRILIEEKILLDHFGEDYRAYQARTKRLLPFVW